MKKISKKMTAILLAFAITLWVFPANIIAFAESDPETVEFNLFRDADFTDEFIEETTELSNSNWSDHYFSSITMTLGDAEMSVDGEEVSVSQPATVDDNGEIILPVMELAETLGEDAEIDQETGDIIVEEDEERTNLNALSADSISEDVSSDVEDIVVSEDNTVTKYMDDGSVLTQLPAISESQAEEVWNLDVNRDGDKIIITSPYQTKEIILFVKDGKSLQNNYEADSVVTNDQGLYFLEYSSESLTKSAYEALLADPEIQYVTLNEIVTANTTTVPDSWGTNGNENSMGIQADIMKNYLGQHRTVAKSGKVW